MKTGILVKKLKNKGYLALASKLEDNLLHSIAVRLKKEFKDWVVKVNYDKKRINIYSKSREFYIPLIDDNLIIVDNSNKDEIFAKIKNNLNLDNIVNKIVNAIKDYISSAEKFSLNKTFTDNQVRFNRI